MDRERVRRRLTGLLVLAYSGELGAIYAYLGHRASLPFGSDRDAIRQILVDEIRHRRIFLRILHDLGAAPDPRRERKARRVGLAIAAFCRVGGWFLPMYGAARLERNNVVEYEVAARLALQADRPRDVDTLLHLAEVELEHERTLRAFAASHPFWRVVPRWLEPPPPSRIRETFARFARNPRTVRVRRFAVVR